MATSVDTYLSQGYTKFQLKVGGNVQEDIERIKSVRAKLDEVALSKGQSPGYYPIYADANTGWLCSDALRVVHAVKDVSNLYIEQPCASYHDNLVIRNKTNLPFIIDENLTDIEMMSQIIKDKSADAVNIKISKVGGLTKARAIRDLAMSHNIQMNIEDTWGGDIVTAAIAALAHSTKPNLLLCSTDFNSYGPTIMANTSARAKEGRMIAPTEAGLGVDPDPLVLGAPVFSIR